MQNHHLIAFEIKKLKYYERHYSIYDKEILAFLHALTKFKQYLVGSKFKIKTNHNSLKYFLEQELNEHQQKWVSKVQAYDFVTEYVKGKNNVVANALSRQPTSLSLMSISTDWRSLLSVEYSENKFACELTDGQIQDDMYIIIDDIIYYKGKIYLVPESTLKRKIIQVAHYSSLSGHQRFLKTYRQI